MPSPLATALATLSEGERFAHGFYSALTPVDCIVQAADRLEVDDESSARTLISKALGLVAAKGWRNARQARVWAPALAYVADVYRVAPAEAVRVIRA